VDLHIVETSKNVSALAASRPLRALPLPPTAVASGHHCPSSWLRRRPARAAASQPLRGCFRIEPKSRTSGKHIRMRKSLNIIAILQRQQPRSFLETASLHTLTQTSCVRYHQLMYTKVLQRTPKHHRTCEMLPCSS